MLVQMRRTLLALLCALALLLVGARAEAKYAPPPIAGHVTDAAGRLTPAEIASLDEKLANYRRCSSNHIAVFFPRSLEGNSIEDVAFITFNTWKIGEGKEDNGVLLVLATNERKVRIETGKGVGGELTDVASSHILRDDVNPNLKADRFFAAADRATTSIAKALGVCAIADARPVPAGRRTFASPDASAELRAGLASTFAVIVCVILVGLRSNIWIAAGVGVVAGVVSFAGATLLARGVGGDDLVTILTVLVPLNALGGVALVPVFVNRDRGKKERRSKRRRRKKGDDGGGPWDGGGGGGGGSSEVSSSSDYSGGGGSSGGGGASDSY